MLTAFLVVQVAVNLALTLALFLLLRERGGRAAHAAAREARLEALAAEFCALGREIAAPPSPRQVEVPRLPAPPPSPESAAGSQPGAALPADRGLPVGAVACRTALLEGEMQVLRNLRRSQAAGGGRRKPPAESPGREARATGRPDRREERG